MSAIRNFLLVFDHFKNELILQKDYGNDVESATRAYAELEKKYQGNSAIDIVLVGSDSIDTVQKTHSTYFKAGKKHLLDQALSFI